MFLISHDKRSYSCYQTCVDTRKLIPTSKWPGDEKVKSGITARKVFKLGQKLYRQMRNFCLHLGVIAAFCGIAYNNLITQSYRQNQYLKEKLIPSQEVNLLHTQQYPLSMSRKQPLNIFILHDWPRTISYSVTFWSDTSTVITPPYPNFGDVISFAIWPSFNKISKALNVLFHFIEHLSMLAKHLFRSVDPFVYIMTPF